MKPTPSNKQFTQIMDHFKDMFYWRDIEQNCFIGCNNKFLAFLGASKQEDIIGKTGYDYFENDIVNLFRDNEKKCLAENKPVNFVEEIDHPKTGKTIIDVTISPIFDDNNKASTIICYGTTRLILSDKPWADALKLIKGEHIHNIVVNNKYFVKIDGTQARLSRRESMCCLFALKGFSSKEIAKEMDLAPKTIDNYLESVKTKLNCSSRQEISKMLLDCNFIELF